MSEDTPDILPEVPDTPEMPDEEVPDTPEVKVYTVKEYLQDISPLLTEGVLRVILAKRRLSSEIPLEDLDERELDLAEAEVYFHLSNLPVGGATNKEVDGSWSHTEGGWTVSSENIKQWRQKYIDLREKWGEEVITKRKIRIINL